MKRSSTKEGSEYLAVTDMTVLTFDDKPAELILKTPLSFQKATPLEWSLGLEAIN